MNILRILRRMDFLSPRRRVQWYPPFWLMRVKVLELDDQWQRVYLRLPLNAFSRNMAGSMFGGFQALLADPIASLACSVRFPRYSVCTQAMNIEFIAEGNSDLELRFEFDPAIDAKIRADLARKGRSTPCFNYGFYRSDGVLCTRVMNTVAIRPRRRKASLSKHRR